MHQTRRHPGILSELPQRGQRGFPGGPLLRGAVCSQHPPKVYGSALPLLADASLCDTKLLMIVVNTETVAGYRVQRVLGLVQGNTVRAKNFGRDFLAGLKNIVGGELSEYTELLTESRQQATQRMLDEATRLGANAVINVRYSTSAVTAGAAELYAYGTAVLLVPES